MQEIKQIALVIVALCSMIGAPLLASSTVAAQASDRAACEGLGGTFSGGKCSVRGQANIDDVIANVINILSIIAGITSVVMIIISGFRFITADGDSSTVAAARRTLLYALVGLIVVAASQSIVWFVLERGV